jgi:hypothetical protein
MIIPSALCEYRPALRIFELQHDRRSRLAGALSACNTTVGAGLLANASNYSPLQRLTGRIRQQAGIYRFWCHF